MWHTQKRWMLIVPFGFIVYYLLLELLLLSEQQHNEANIKSLGDALWYSVVTLTTVGYGDRYPITPFGRFIGFVFLIFSIGLLGILIGKISESLTLYRKKKQMGYKGTQFHQHIVIIGWNPFAKKITDILVAAHRHVAIITNSKDDIDSIYQLYDQDHVFVLFSPLDETEVFHHVNITESLIVFLNHPTDVEKLVAMLNLKHTYPQLKFIVSLDDAELRQTFHIAGAAYTLSKNEIAAKLIASYIFEPDVADFSTDLLSSATSEDDYDIAEFLVTETNPFAGKRYGEVFEGIRHRFGCLLIGIAKSATTNDSNSGRHRLMKLAAADTLVEVGDYLIIIVNGVTLQQISEAFDVHEGIAPRHLHKARRFGVRLHGHENPVSVANENIPPRAEEQ